MKTLQELKEICDDVTPGPWEYYGRLIAAAREALPALIEEVERLREALEKVIIPTGATVSKEELQISSYALRTLAQSKERLP